MWTLVIRNFCFCCCLTFILITTNMGKLSAILWKNYLLKKAHLSGFLAELFLPVAFMVLLILIKIITDKYDSPNVAFYCGNAYPWFYSDSLLSDSYNQEATPLTCTIKPPECEADHYYQFAASYTLGRQTIQGYGQYGYTKSAASNRKALTPFYTYTIADRASFYGKQPPSQPLKIDNPSLPFCSILYQIRQNNAIFAVAPETASNSMSAIYAQNLRAYFIQQCNVTKSSFIHQYHYHNFSQKENFDFSSSIIYFNSQSDLDNYVTDRHYDDINYGFGKVAFAVVLYSVDTTSLYWDYAVRANYTSAFDESDPTVACLYSSYYDCIFTYSVPTTRYYTKNLMKPQSARYLYGYGFSGFSAIQQMVDKFIFLQTSGKEVNIMASVSLMPTAAFKTDNFQSVVSNTLGIFYMLSFLYPVSRIIRSLVLEKESRIREGMKMMGLSDTVYNLSWLITTMIQMTLVSILITLVTSSSVFEYSDKFLVFIFLEAFSLAAISMCFLLSSLFSKAKTASLIGPIIFFTSFFPYYAVYDEQFSTAVKTATCLSAPACFAFGANVFADFEGGLVGIHVNNYAEKSNNMSYAVCVGMLFVDAILYGILAWYFDKVIPSEYGTPLPLYFPFLSSYWFGVTKSNRKIRKNTFSVTVCSTLRRIYESIVKAKRAVSDSDEDIAIFMSNPLHEGQVGEPSQLYETLIEDDLAGLDFEYLASNPLLEPISAEWRQQMTGDSNMKCISIRNLRKEFGSSYSASEHRLAVEDLNMDAFQGQVTVLLGHNGAGKSTTIGMLVGLIPPSSGTAVMPGGFTIGGDLQAIRQNLGVCPQHDILFPELTALEHLQLYASFKGVPPSQIDSDAQRMINEVGLKEKANAKSGTLSGGQKRKLSLGIALIGDSKIVILDEPTSGMDPYSRRSIWNIIQRNKKGRVILLTTHFMDEADLLGDRIAIMSNGKLQCMGSSLFLKRKFGVGYTLTFVKKHAADNSSDIGTIIQRHISEVEPLSSVGTEQSFRLPFSSSNQFEGMFKEIDTMKDLLGIIEYGISVTTLEEVFLRADAADSSVQTPTNEEIGKPNDCEDSTVISILPADTDYVLEPAIDENEVIVTFLKHFTALLVKRFQYGKRDKQMMLCQCILPFVVVIVGLSLLLLRPNLNQQDLILSPIKYNPNMDIPLRNFVPFSVAGNNTQSNVATQMRSLFNSGQETGVYGVAVPVEVSLIEDVDTFDGCSVGASPLYNMSRYLLQTQPENEEGSSRYGAITIDSSTNLTDLNYNVMINGSAVHGVGIYVNQVHQAFLQVLSNTSNAKIITRNYPLPPTYKQETQTAKISAFIAALFCMIACCFIPASFAVFIVKEREVKAKHQQIISGVNIYAYWCSSFIWDILSYIPTALLIYVAMIAFDITAYTKGSSAFAVIYLLMLFGPSTAAMTYLLSFLFVNHSTAQVVVMFFNFFTGLCLVVVSFIFTVIPRTMEADLTLRYVFRLFPSFCLGDGLIQLALCTGETCPAIDKNGYSFFSYEPPLSWNTTGADISFMAVESVVYFLLVLLIEYFLTFPAFLSCLHKVDDCPYEFNPENEDEDVVAERKRVLSGNAESDVVRIEELRKVYPINNRNQRWTLYSIRKAFLSGLKQFFFGKDYVPVPADNSSENKVAVQSLCFGVPKGECFGFLGINGAGKTTTLSILSGEFPPTSGLAFIDGFSILENQSKIRNRIGYCPQFDSLLDLLTVREHLELYAIIKGISKCNLQKAVNDKIDQLGLRNFADKTAKSLSGGNKRKLTVAVATIGNPSVVFLDEPSTGMDPISKRFMWKVIAGMSSGDRKCSIILTTHSMEEAEALCNRIGVMVNGRLCCIGSGQHLKYRFGNGYEVNIKADALTLLSSRSILSDIKEIISSNDSPISEDSKRLLLDNNELLLCLTESSAECINSSEQEDNNKLSEYESNRLHAIHLSQAYIDALCNALNGLKSRIPLLRERLLGSILEESLHSDGFLSFRSFLEWYLAEDISDCILDFMRDAFPGRHSFLERSSMFTFRYRIFKNVDQNSIHANSFDGTLADIFSKFERNKSALRISEYSIGQTTLEQVFNQFAAGQDNPEIN